jgi:integrase
MPRPSKDGAPAREPHKRQFTELFIQKVRAEKTVVNHWDTHTRGLALQVQPTGHRSYKAVYSRAGRPRWYHIGSADQIGLKDARKIAAEVMLAAIKGQDPAAERKAERGAGTFGELAERYVEEFAKKTNKSWRHTDGLVRRYLLPRWGKLPAKDISRADVKAMMGRIKAPILANQVLAAASAIFSWGVKQEIVAVNPCHGVDRNKTRSRERVLSDSEIARFWTAFDSAGLVAGSALKMILLSGQRPGEVAHMRHEHIVDTSWWVMPGKPDPKLGWSGTKNAESHRVWLSKPVRAIITELTDDDTAVTTGFVFAGRAGRPISGLDEVMRKICADLAVAEKVTPHDLRRTFSTKVTGLEFGRDAMNRVTNHKEGGIASVYDRHEYEKENKRIMEAVAAHILTLAEGPSGDGTVVEFLSRRVQ